MDWLAAAFSLTGVFLMGRKLKVSWLVFLLSNVLWIAYCFPHDLWAQLSLECVFIVLNVLGYRKWSRDASNQTAAQSTKVDLTAAPLPSQVQTRCTCGGPIEGCRRIPLADLNKGPRPGYHGSVYTTSPHHD